MNMGYNLLALQLINDIHQFGLGFSYTLLNSAQKLFFLAFFVTEVIFGKLAVFGFQLTFDFVPVSFYYLS